jgi:two-component system OmpR family response regulator
MSTLLLVEDDPVLGRGLILNLENEGYQIHWAKSLRDAAQTSTDHRPDLVILDLGLPDGSGLSFLKDLRQAGSMVPVIILTAKADEDTVVEGLQLGANDYVRKPFGDRELLARIKTALREPQSRDRQLRFGDLLLLLDRRQLVASGQEVDLSPREFDLLVHFVQNAGKVVSREALLRVFDKDGEIFDRTVDSHVSHVRTRLKKAGVKTIQISSVYGVGYRLEKT